MDKSLNPVVEYHQKWWISIGRFYQVAEKPDSSAG